MRKIFDGAIIICPGDSDEKFACERGRMPIDRIGGGIVCFVVMSWSMERCASGAHPRDVHVELHR
jgi:hypothetical protein